MEKIKSFDTWLERNTIDEEAMSRNTADVYAKRSGVDTKKISGRKSSELANGGGVDSIMIDIVRDLEQKTGFEFMITAGNDLYHQGITSYTSNHTTGFAVDIVSPSLTSKINRKTLEYAILNLILSGKYNKNGKRLGGINEYDRSIKMATGGHFHISLTTDKASRDGKEFSLPLIGMTSYSQVRNKIAAGQKSAHVNKQIAKKSPRRYYKVYDKDNRRMLVAKYKGSDLFKIYTKRRDLIGEVTKKDNVITMIDDGVPKDITSTVVGQTFARLFKLAEAGNLT